MSTQDEERARVTRWIADFDGMGECLGSQWGKYLEMADEIDRPTTSEYGAVLECIGLVRGELGDSDRADEAECQLLRILALRSQARQPTDVVRITRQDHDDWTELVRLVMNGYSVEAAEKARSMAERHPSLTDTSEEA